MITREELPKYLQAGCRVSLLQDTTNSYKVILHEGTLKIIPYQLVSIPRTYYRINQVGFDTQLANPT